MTGSIAAGSFDRLRIEQQRSNALAAKLFVENTLGQRLATDDLHQELKDGVVLCSLLNKIQAGTVVHINKKDQAFVKMANISSFLQGASKLGLQNSELFQTVDLWEAKDMMAVVHTILSLARLNNKRSGCEPKSLSQMQSLPVDNQNVKASIGVRKSTASRNHDKFSKATEHDKEINQSQRNRRHKKHESKHSAAAPTPSGRSSRRKEEDATKASYLDVRNVFSHSTTDQNQQQSLSMVDKENRRKSLNSLRRPSITQKRSSLDLSSDDGLGSIVQWHSKRRSTTDSAYGSLNFMDESEQEGAKSEIQGVQQTLLEIRDVLNSRAPASSPKLPEPKAMPPLRLSPSKSSPTTNTNDLEIDIKSQGNGQQVKATENNANAQVENGDKQQRERVALRDDNGNVIAQYVSDSFPKHRRIEKIVHFSLSSNWATVSAKGNSVWYIAHNSCRALDIDTGHLYAIKRIKIELQDGLDQEMMQEVELLKSMDHPNVVKYVGCVRTKKYLDVILEFVESGSLLSTLKSFGTFSENLVAAYTVKILLGLSYLHAKEVVHCDLKAANILATKTGSVKLTDFGVSLNLKLKQVDNGEPVGTPNWMAPEIIELQGASVKSDIWSLGCTIIELYSGKPPYSDLISMSALYRIVEDDVPPLPIGISEPMKKFLLCCFQKDPRKRPSAVELLRHDWLAGAFAAEGDVSRLWRSENELFVNKISSFTTMNRSDNCLPGRTNAGDDDRPRIDLVRLNTRRGSLPARKAEKVHVVHHSFLKTTFEKAIVCKVCEYDIRRHGMFCEACAIVCHDKCRSLAPHCVNATKHSENYSSRRDASIANPLHPPSNIPNHIPKSRQDRSSYPSSNNAGNMSSPNLLGPPKRPINLRRRSRPESDNCIIC
ncbi:hypothetical protein NQZ79_g2483 [Umbelopsis isabellina]|nr:hypothetical protein NQZ79_g2483 [Umbelopsis isabellina]